jgi:hypothetical protein
MYIQEKYKNIVWHSPFSLIGLFFNNKTNETDMVFFFKDKSPFWLEKNKNKEINVEGYMKDYIRYKKILKKTPKRFLLFDATIQETDSEFGHAITVLYDKLTNEMELFQRNTSEEKYTPYEEAKPLLLFFFRDVFGKKVKPVYNNNLCIKTFEISNHCSSMYYNFYRRLSGDCMIWALWYLELRLKNRDIPRRQVLARAIKIFTKDIGSGSYKSDISLACRIMLGYKKFVDDFTDQFIVSRNSEDLPIKINKKKSTPLLTKAGRLMKTYLFLIGKNLKIIKTSI